MRTTRDSWAKRVEQWKASGLTAKEFAPRVGVRPSALSWWKWHLGSRRATAKGSQKRRQTPAQGALAVSPLTFIEMSAPRTEPLEVILVSGIRVLVRGDFDATVLARLVDALERRG